jgi:hypothetical protein
MVEKEMITTALKEYNITDAAIAKLEKDYLSLKVINHSDDEGYKLVHTAKMEIVHLRTDVEKKRVSLKSDALAFGRAVDAEAKRITALLAPIESHLITQEKIVDDEKARIKAIAEQKEVDRIKLRFDRLFSFGCSFNGMNYVLPFAPTGYAVPQAIVKTCTDEQFETVCAEFQKLVDIEQKRIVDERAAKLAEEERLAKVRTEQEAEAQRLAAIAKEQAAAAAKIKAEQDAINAEKQKIANAQALENAKKEAAEKVKIETENRLKREAEEKAAAEAKAKKEADKKAARAPDKVKIKLLADSLDAIQTPDVKSEDGKTIALWAMMAVTELVKRIRDKAEEL